MINKLDFFYIKMLILIISGGIIYANWLQAYLSVVIGHLRLCQLNAMNLLRMLTLWHECTLIAKLSLRN